MKTKLIALFLLILPTIILAQTDSAQTHPKTFVGFYLRSGIQHMNFSELRPYGFLLNQPPNTSIKTDVGILLGNRDKLLISAYMGFSSFPIYFSLNKQKKGSFNNYSIKASGSYSFWGMSLFYNLFPKTKSKLFRAIYPNTGIQFVDSYISSEATGAGISNVDTTFYYEQSHVKSTLINISMMVELAQLFHREKNNFGSIPLTFTAGYTLQIQNPKWTYTTRPPNLNDPRKVNQGGLYFMIGYNLWFHKGMMKPIK